ncbi:acyltransferase [Ochrobactrum sp. Q0168]|uniref:acyltransferase family protein n=1 Tax=Ochrobactrum sp. Q0168 TaxID=2793241 RepID=UPI0018EE189A|nr:acyltransferase [Ochrobactrum sp. Q0168]
MHKSTDRLVILEGMRGLAALIVVVYHSILAFHPAVVGRYIDDPAVSVAGTPLFSFINGTAAVAFFFTLSGFVLVYRAVDDQDVASINRNLMRRWPRLAMPVVVITITSWALFYFDAYSYGAAAEISKSGWLNGFGGSPVLPLGKPVSDAVSEGLFFTFFRGDYNYNTALWTMHFEFIGSFIVFGLAYFIIAVKADRGLSLYAIGVVTVLASIISPWYLCFTLGVVIALFQRDVKSSLPFKAFAILAAIYMMGYFNPIGWYWYLDGIDRVFIYAAASMLLIVAFLQSSVEGWIAKLFAILGELSFPIYLAHMLVITSVGSWIYVRVHEAGGRSAIAAVSASLLLSVVASIPLIYLNRFWLRAMGSVGRSRRIADA